MEKMLLVGVNTRPLTQSAYQLGYEIFSTSYFCTSDFNSYHHKKCILKQKTDYSCGNFEESFHSSVLLDLASSYIDRVDHIIPYTGVLPDNFPSSKILGNKRVENIVNKYKLYKKLKKKFLLPLTYLSPSLEEIQEIRLQFPEKEFIIKPIFGSGGYGIEKLNKRKRELDDENFILQEFIPGENVSTSVLSTIKESKAIISSRQLYVEDYASKNSFIYAGNVAPYPGIDVKFNSVAQEVVKELSLIGSNGVDMIIKDNDIYIIEVNPRIQGTFECSESSLGINMIEAHVKACQGELINCPKPNKYTLKKILYAPYKTKVGNLNNPGVHDIPLTNTIIEKGEPIATVIHAAKDLAEVQYKVNITSKQLKEKWRKC